MNWVKLKSMIHERIVYASHGYSKGFEIIKCIWKGTFPKNSNKTPTLIEKIILISLQLITQFSIEEIKHFFKTEKARTNFTDCYVVCCASGFIICMLYFWQDVPKIILRFAALYVIIQNMNTQLRIVLLDHYKNEGWEFYSHNRLLLLSIFNYLQIIAGFAILYLSTASIIYSSCKEIVSGPLDAFYFSFITSTTLGYGDIVPASSLGKILAMIELLFGIMIISIIIAKFVSLNKNQYENE